MTPSIQRPIWQRLAQIEKTFGKKPIPVRGGGSIPICSILEKELGIKIVFMGFGLDSDNLHSPNEKYGLVNSIRALKQFLISTSTFQKWERSKDL
jgi:acetylornithine deacetylase/succinyl-diaminopimelate desuccinylase-like protein